MKRFSSIPILAAWLSVFSVLGLGIYLLLDLQFGSFMNFYVKVALSINTSAIFSPPWLGIIAQIAPSTVGLENPPVGPDRWKKYKKAFMWTPIFAAPIHFIVTTLLDVFVFGAFGYLTFLESIGVGLASPLLVGVFLSLEVFFGGQKANLEGSD